MAQPDIYIIHSNSKIESLYTLFPLLVSKYSSYIRFVNSASKEARNATGKCVILVRTFKGNQSVAGETEKKRAVITDFRKRFDRVIMLDDGAGSDSLHFEYMDLVDLYYKGKLLKDKSHYLKPMYGRQIFTNYYHETFGVADAALKWREIPADPRILEKLRVSWNLGCGPYPVPEANVVRLARGATHLNAAKVLKPWFVHSYKKMIAELGCDTTFGKKTKKIQARFGSNALPNTIGFQRKIFIEKCRQHDAVLTGSITPKAYKAELKNVAAVLSPFGWGEICFRDFEAISNGSLLIKPDMEHIDTWPAIYKKEETYLSVDWDGTNLVDTINRVSENASNYRPLVSAAKDTYRTALLNLETRVLHFLEEASGSPLN